ncbi:hypothetical protein KSP40_PGU015662 [Platanthera guangdongensis]|uniref:Arginyl-tRNA synthetase catalytic core domain-containing protein n=1 Tax=Platanthera guangdongensis TaxID=2320717 RepID=A0ABR2MKZ7_9ASPA
MDIPKQCFRSRYSSSTCFHCANLEVGNLAEVELEQSKHSGCSSHTNDSSDVACVKFSFVRTVVWKNQVTDAATAQAARRAGWLPDAKSNLYPKANHVGFGLVLGSDGKRFRTRSSEVVRLVELLDEAKSRSKAELVRRLEDNGIAKS